MISLIKGVFDIDGSLYLENKNGKLYPRVEFKTVSSILSEQMKNILNSLDIRTTKYGLFREEKNWNTLYTVAIRGDKMTNKFFKKINPANPKHNLKFNKYRGSS
ncbi:MAG: LAGLIDADG family homing endonuclease [Candidatus Nanoarchaeia archaeon]|nr:LAGLIDADG family homing endonuclease [Candidatus Nanoarchaeia archaeon]